MPAQYDYGPGLGQWINEGVSRGLAAYQQAFERNRQREADARTQEAYDYAVSQRPAQERARDLGLQREEQAVEAADYAKSQRPVTEAMAGASLATAQNNAQESANRLATADDDATIKHNQAQTSTIQADQLAQAAKEKAYLESMHYLKAGMGPEAEAAYRRYDPNWKGRVMGFAQDGHVIIDLDGDGKPDKFDPQNVIDALQGPRKDRYEGKDNYILDKDTGRAIPLPQGIGGGDKPSDAKKKFMELSSGIVSPETAAEYGWTPAQVKAMKLDPITARAIAYNTVEPVKDALNITTGFRDKATNTLVGTLKDGQWVPDPDWLKANGMGSPEPAPGGSPAPAAAAAGGISSAAPTIPEGYYLSQQGGATVAPGQAPKPAGIDTAPMARVSSDADYAQLPPGATFVDSRGRRYQKPGAAPRGGISSAATPRASANPSDSDITALQQRVQDLSAKAKSVNDLRQKWNAPASTDYDTLLAKAQEDLDTALRTRQYFDQNPRMQSIIDNAWATR